VRRCRRRAHARRVTAGGSLKAGLHEHGRGVPPGIIGQSVGSGAAEPTAAAANEEHLEGAIAEHRADPAGARSRSRRAQGSPRAPLLDAMSAWTAVTDRYGAAAPGLIRRHRPALDDYPRSRVFAACTGTVATATYSGTYGNHVIVDFGEGWHLTATSANPPEGGRRGDRRHERARHLGQHGVLHG
jgi:hypothetical protein